MTVATVSTAHVPVASTFFSTTGAETTFVVVLTVAATRRFEPEAASDADCPTVVLASSAAAPTAMDVTTMFLFTRFFFM